MMPRDYDKRGSPFVNIIVPIERWMLSFAHYMYYIRDGRAVVGGGRVLRYDVSVCCI